MKVEFRFETKADREAAQRARDQWLEDIAYLQIDGSKVYHVLTKGYIRTFCGLQTSGSNRESISLEPIARRLCHTCRRSWKWVLCPKEAT